MRKLKMCCRRLKIQVFIGSFFFGGGNKGSHFEIERFL